MVVIALFVAGALSMAYGQMPIASEDPNRLQFTFSPYGWLTGITGNVAAKGISTSPNVSFSDILSGLDFAYAGHLELQKDRWSIYLDPWYAKLKDEGQFGFFGVRMKQYIIEFGGTYRIFNTAIGSEPYSKLGVEGLVGGRYWSTDVRMEFPTFDTSKSKDWLDPIVGARLKAGLLRNLSFHFQGDIGGFSAGSRFSWNTEGLLIYDLSRWFALKLGYRAMGVDYESGSGPSKFKYDVTYYGPEIGLVVKF
jgi:hypothetical protein